MDARLVLQCSDVHRVGGVRRRAVPVAWPPDVRSADRVSTPNVAIARGLEEIWIDLLPRGPVAGEHVAPAIVRPSTAVWIVTGTGRAGTPTSWSSPSGCPGDRSSPAVAASTSTTTIH